LVDLLSELPPTLGVGQALRSRYDVALADLTGESYLVALAEQRYQNDVERAARQLLNDYRKGNLGALPLELPTLEDSVVPVASS